MVKKWTGCKLNAFYSSVNPSISSTPESSTTISTTSRSSLSSPQTYSNSDLETIVTTIRACETSVLQNFIAEKIGNSDGIIEGLADCFWKQASSVRREGLNFRCCERRSFAKERSLLPKELAASDYSYEFTNIIARMNKFCF